MSYRPGDSFFIGFSTESAAGAATNADSTPAGKLRRNGTIDNAVTITVTPDGTQAGDYVASGTIPSSYAVGDDLSLRIIATISSVTAVGYTELGQLEPAASGNGARAVTFTVTDGVNPVQNATVRATLGGSTFVNATNASGQATFSLDDGTYTVSVTASGNAFTPTTKVVSSTATAFTLVVTPNTPGTPASPTLCRCTVDNFLNAGVYDFEMLATPTSPVGGYPVPLGTIEVAAGAQGFIDLPQGAAMRYRRNGGAWTSFTVPALATVQLPTALG